MTVHDDRHRVPAAEPRIDLLPATPDGSFALAFRRRRWVTPETRPGRGAPFARLASLLQALPLEWSPLRLPNFRADRPAWLSDAGGSAANPRCC